MFMTEEEMKQWGAHVDCWNEDGSANKPFLKKVRWRK